MEDHDLEYDDEGNVVEQQINKPVDEEKEIDDNEEESFDQEESGEEESSSEETDEEENHEEEDEREAIRARRREERRAKREKIREREDNLRRELAARDAVINELRARQEAIERRSSGTEAAQLQEAKNQTAQAYNYYKDQIRIATEAGNGAAVADATEKLIQTQRRFDELTSYENALKTKRSAPQPLDARLVNHAQDWMSRNKWYDPASRDPDIRITMTLDQQLADEGWDPTTKEYWDELDNRVKKYLPHRSKRANVQPNKSRSIVSGSGRESGGGAAKQSANFRLSPERVKALKDAGIWDNPTERAEAVKRFREYDKTHKA